VVVVVVVLLLTPVARQPSAVLVEILQLVGVWDHLLAPVLRKQVLRVKTTVGAVVGHFRGLLDHAQAAQAHPVSSSSKNFIDRRCK
jgi:hypothetical protein